MWLIRIRGAERAEVYFTRGDAVRRARRLRQGRCEVIVGPCRWLPRGNEWEEPDG